MEVVMTGSLEVKGDGLVEPKRLYISGKNLEEILLEAMAKLEELEPDIKFMRVKFEMKRLKQLRVRHKPGKKVAEFARVKNHDEILTGLLGQWCVTPQPGGSFAFNKLMEKEEAIYQVVLSGDLITDGVYELSDFKLYELADQGTKVPIPNLVMRDYDMVNSFLRKTADELKESMIKFGAITEEEFHRFFVSDKTIQRALARKMPILQWNNL